MEAIHTFEMDLHLDFWIVIGIDLQLADAKRRSPGFLLKGASSIKRKDWLPG